MFFFCVLFTLIPFRVCRDCERWISENKTKQNRNIDGGGGASRYLQLCGRRLFLFIFFLSLRKESKLLLFGLQATKTARIFFQEKMEGVGKEFKN